MRRVSSFFVTASLFALTGCPSEPLGRSSYAVTACTDDGRCVEGESCVEDRCLEACAADAECPAGAVCVDGGCWAGRGGACTTDSECGSGSLCAASTCAVLPGSLTCTDHAECPAGSLCDAGECRVGCGMVGALCGAGQVCTDGICIDEASPCGAEGAFCAAGQVCVEGVCTTGECGAEICGNGIDEDCDGVVDDGCEEPACTADAECPEGQACVAGACTGASPCGAERVLCAAGQVCVEGVCTTGECGAEICGNGTDEDCDGVVDDGCEEPACTADAECDDGNACTEDRCEAGMCVTGGGVEICGNDEDDDCDGLVDDGCGSACRTSTECASGQVCVEGRCTSGDSSCVAEICGNGIDEDCDGVVDDGCGGAGCMADADCGMGQVCVMGACRVG
jgi:hypothetical protein